jgi:hypothetical protein
VASATTTTIGDLLYYDPWTSQLQRASQINYGSLTAAQIRFAKLFAGIAEDKSDAGDTDPVKVSTRGIQELPCASATWEVGDLIAVDDNAAPDALLDAQVILTYDRAAAIGQVVQREAVATTTVWAEVWGRWGQFSVEDYVSPSGVFEFNEEFFGAALLDDGTVLWEIDDTSAAGAPTHALLDEGHGGVYKMTLANNDEVEVLSLNWGDVNSLDIDLLLSFEAHLAASTIAANELFVCGLGTNQADDEDAVTANCWFKAEAAMDLLVETDDGVTDDDDNDTTLNLVADTEYRLGIEFWDKTNIIFRVDGARVLSASTFTMTGFSACLQPYIQLQKASGAGVPYLLLNSVQIRGIRN